MASQKNFHSVFCPKCGSNQEPFVQGFCLNCYSADHELISLPSELFIEFCVFCSKVKLQGKWISQSEQTLTNFLIKLAKNKKLHQPQITVFLQPLEEGRSLAHVDIAGTLEGQLLEFNRTVLLLPRRGVCDSCSKQKGGYFEATLQVRWINSSDRTKKAGPLTQEILQYLKEVHEKDPLAFVLKKSDTAFGLDFQLGSKKAAKRTARYLAKKYNSEVTTSFKLHSKHKNVELKRLTYCVRV